MWLVLTVGCARPKAEAQPSAATASTPAPMMFAQAAPTAAPVAPGQTVDADAPQDTNAPAILERIPASVQQQTVATSPGLAEVVKLAQAGVGEEVILAYIEKYSGKFQVGSEQILYLNDLGISTAVMTAMLKHDGADTSLATAPTTTEPPPGVTTPTGAPGAQGGNPPLVTAPLTPQGQTYEAAPPTVTTTVAPPPTSDEVAYFYDTLSPYGSWVYLSGYGWCWQPTVAVSVPTWRPYCDRGRWYWSDAGWYWNSDYSWGWAAFHYGRWYHHAGSGWVWRPGLAWGPSWVSWRYYDGYCGWAPLPPEAHFVVGSGFTYYGRHATVGFDFGLAPFHYTFVSVNNFCDYSPYRYAVPHTRVQNFYRNTTVVNNYIVGNNNRIVNNGIGRETVARSSTTRIREVSIRERPVSNMAQVRGDRIERQGNQTVVYRPELPKNPPQVRSAQFASRSGTAASSAPSRGGNNGVVARGNESRGQNNVARASTGISVDSGRTSSSANNNDGRPERTNQRGNPARVERSTGTRDNAVTAPNTPPRQQAQPQTPQSRPQAQPQSRPQTQAQPQSRPQQTQPQTQPRGSANAPLFESRPAQNSAAAARPIERTTPIPQPQPRVQAQPSQNSAAAARPNVQADVPRARVGQGATRNYSDYGLMPPRQHEQTSPRYTAPAHSAPAQSAPVYRAPAAPQYNAQPTHPSAVRPSAPEGRSAPAARQEGGRGGGGEGRGNGGGGGGGRVERNR